jgi:hypothetical protein
VYYKVFSFKGIPIIIIIVLYNRFVYNGRRSGKGIRSLSESREGFANITGLYDR